MRGLTIRELALRLLAQIEAVHQPTMEPVASESADRERTVAEAGPELLKKLMAGLADAPGNLEGLAATAD